MLSPLIDSKELLSISDSKDLVILDASGGPSSKANYEAKHLRGAIWVDLEKELADVGDAANGGRHPLPSIADFGKTLGELGISPGTHVVVYDDKSGGNAAARMWWMLKAIGHEKVQLLDGGLKGAEAASYPMSSGPQVRQATKIYPVQGWSLPQVDINEVAKAAEHPDRVVIDVRAARRYAGEVEPIDLIAGHIPGAINIPFEENLDGEGRFLAADVLREKYASILEGKTTNEVIVHCGSGVTACHTLLAMEYAGYGIPKLYVGSWSEWSRNDRPMVTKEA